jgi:uncharacterized protein (DUF2147 family)
MKFGLCSAFSAALFAFTGIGPALADPRGLWLAQDGARVRVRPCGQGFCATIASPKSALDPATGAPWTDKNNADPRLRSRPLVGVEVLSATTPDGAGRWSGTLYNVDNGQTYTGRLIEVNRATIRVEGCVIGLCGGQNMQRIE